MIDHVINMLVMGGADFNSFVRTKCNPSEGPSLPRTTVIIFLGVLQQFQGRLQSMARGQS